MSKPSQVSILDADETSLTLSLPASAAGDYQVEYVPYGEDWSTCKSLSVPAAGGTFTVTDLVPASTYQVRVVSGGETGDEMVLDTGVPGCSGKKKKRGCVVQ
ncbi:hypothetical protein TeGR_g4967 [Tetraparma gracilis]|jgi:hypothetical protein|uniref:Fibronectin type-III domain-containing protein n=1 Tax=Tetraparma gracilis TaxID=2962635 RepID=A0ABQ6M8M6_9STRA|nr:hypothetical protein TeGR_g4967 [Tetraparma gracilis]